VHRENAFVIEARNVLGEPLASCGASPLTGFYRDGCCNTGAEDLGAHVVCARVTAEFLQFSLDRGNDLVTPRNGFPGLRPGDRWCLCVGRWAEALAAGKAPRVVLEATHETALEYVTLAELKRHAVDLS
jgi:uncharacterized protein (DUF2237 family)